MPRTSPLLSLTDLALADHICYMYDTESEHRAVLTPFLSQGIERGEKIIYAADTHTAEVVLEYLHDAGLDTASFLQSGQLNVVSVDKAYIRDGRFDPDEMIALLRAETERALAEGYTGLRFTGEMTWMVRRYPGSDRAMEYEVGLSAFLAKSKCIEMCQYDRRHFDPKTLLSVLSTHPIAVIGHEVCENFYYLPQEKFVGLDHPETTLRLWLKTLAVKRRAQEAAIQDAVVREGTLAGKALGEDVERLRLAEGAASAGIWDWDIATGKMKWSEECRRLLGQSAGDLCPTYESWLQCVHADDREGVSDNVVQALAQKRELSIEHRVAHPDGTVLWLHSRGRIVYDGAGRPVRGIGICIDITERKRNEERLKKLNECLLSLRENPEENIKRLTALCEEALGGEKVLYHRLDDKSLPVVFGEFYVPGEGGEKAPSETFGDVTSDKGSASASPSRDASRSSARRPSPGVGNVAMFQMKPRMDVGVQCKGKHVGLLHAVWKKGAVPTAEDIKFLETVAVAIGTEEIRREGAEASARREKERVQQEEELRAREKRYRELLENANSIILKMDTKGNITYFNEFAQKFFGYAPDEIVGKSVVGTIVPKAGTAGRDLDFMIKNICKYPEQYATNQNENMKKSGERALIAWTNRAIRDEQGNIAEILCIGNDITEFQHLQERLLQSKKMEALGRLAGGVAHDFSSLLATIANHASKAKKALPPDSSLRGDIEEVLKNAEGASHFSRQLLAFSRQFIAFSKHQAGELKTVDLNELVRAVEDALRKTLHKGIELVVTLAPGLGPVKADPAPLSEVIINLVSNACDAMPKGGTLTIETSNVTLDEKYVRMHAYATPGEFVTLTVRDTGIGMTEEVRAHIFEPFFIAKGDDKGSGLGLPTAYGIVKQYRGYIDVSSEAGKGTTFTIYLPRVKE